VLRKNFQDEGRVRSPREKGSQKEVENVTIAQLFLFFLPHISSINISTFRTMIIMGIQFSKLYK